MLRLASQCIVFYQYLYYRSYNVHGSSWEAGELESWRAGEQESWRAGELESWRAGELESWRAGELGVIWSSEYWKNCMGVVQGHYTGVLH